MCRFYDHFDSVYGKLDEPRSFDNVGYSIFIVNEYQLKPNESLLALSLDHILDINFPVNSIVSQQSIPISIKNLKAKSTFQTELLEAPLPRIATLRALRNSDGPIAYKLQINAQEAKLVRKKYKNFFIVTPGIRLPGDSSNDQLRVMTPNNAFKNKVSAIVMGRSIIKGNIKNNIKKLIDHLNQ